jgi:quercetin dioxygenase-like cupin family protein
MARSFGATNVLHTTQAALPVAGSATAGLLIAAVIAALIGPMSRLSPWPQLFIPDLSNLCASTIHASVAAEAPRATAEVISTEKLSHVPGKNISVVRVTFPPGGLSPRHYHGGSATLYVLSGTIRSQIEGEPVATLKTGDTYFEPLGSIHLFAENASQTEAAVVLAVFVHDEGATLTTYF